MKKESKAKVNKFTAYKTRQKEKGLVFVSVWVPEGDADQLKIYAERKRKAHAKKNG